MAHEIELKLALAECDQARFLRHPLLRTAASRHVETLDNIYYDTPDLSLRRHGVALRLRRQGRRWLQTVKLAGKEAAGLTSRPEWETPYCGHFDFTPIEVSAVREWLERPELLACITPICETRFRRITWHFPAGDGTVLLTLDRGWITADNHKEPISEIEMELDGAPVSAIFAIARQLAQRVSLAPAVFSKAERGYRLHAGTPSAPLKANAVVIDRTLRPASAFLTIASACLHHLQQNYPGALRCDDSAQPEYIHQMRFALQRLCVAFSEFEPQCPPGLAQRLAEFPQAAFARLLVELDPAAPQRTLQTLTAPAYGQILLAAMGALHSLDEPDSRVVIKV